MPVDPDVRRQLREVAEAATEVFPNVDRVFAGIFDPPTVLSLLDALDEADARLALLADPAPEPRLTKDEAAVVKKALDRLSAAPRADIARAIATIEDSRQTHVEWIEYLAKHGDDLRPHEEVAGDAEHHREAVEQYEQVLSVLRASAAPVPEGVPEDHRVCSHGIYHHGCPSCDRQDPEERLWEEGTDA